MMMNSLSLAFLLISALALTGCGQSAKNAGSADAPRVAADDEPLSGDDAGHRHEGWWCDEHGVPEGICAQCSSKVAADFKAKGDWCQEHDVPESQCFVCHPEEEQTFAAHYEAKYGKQPPKRAGAKESGDSHAHGA